MSNFFSGWREVGGGKGVWGIILGKWEWVRKYYVWVRVSAKYFWIGGVSGVGGGLVHCLIMSI